MKVWVVLQTEYGYYEESVWVASVFSSENAAISFVENNPKLYLDIEEMEVTDE